MVTKGVPFHPDPEVADLAQRHGVATSGPGAGRPLLDTAIKACDTILATSGTTNGRLATAGFEQLEARTGTKLTDLSVGSQDRRVTFTDTVIQPQPVITSPEWSGSEHGGRRYSAFVINMERHKPWHTLTGRMHYYLDHDWMRDMGESLPIFRPPLDVAHIYDEPPAGYTGTDADGAAVVSVRYMTPHLSLIHI
mgnify:FL=1